MKNKSTKILYTYTARRSFVVNDLAILKKNHSVVIYHFKTEPKWKTPLSFVLQFLHLLFFGWKYDAFIMFFAGYHSVLPSLFAKVTGKKAIIFLGGTDCFNYPSFQYGNFTKKWYGISTCLSVRLASLLVPVSQNLVLSESGYYAVDSTQQGIYHWCKSLDTPYKVIPLEYDPDLFYKREVERIENSFLTVAFGLEGTSFIRKGVDKVLMLAQKFPRLPFTILGCKPEEFPVEVPANVTLIPPVRYQDLSLYYSRHQFYLQLSIAEGFPSAVCEAMLCECIPIGSDVAAIPGIISSCGFIVKERNDIDIVDTVAMAIDFQDKEALGQQARNQIKRTYGTGTREKELPEIL